MKLFKLGTVICLLGILLLTCSSKPQKDYFQFEIESISLIDKNYNVIEQENAIGAIKLAEEANFYSMEFLSASYTWPLTYFIVTESSSFIDKTGGSEVLYLSGYSVGEDSYDYEWIIRVNEKFMDFTTKRLLDDTILHIKIRGSY